MDGPLPRRCGTCRFHRKGPTPCTGRCLHPDLQPPNGHVRPFVRERELHCYGGWGLDYWEPKALSGWGQDGPDTGRYLSFDETESFAFASRELQWQSSADDRSAWDD